MHRQLDRDLTSEEEELLFVHLSSCTDCQEQFEQLKQLSVSLESLPKVNLSYSIVDQIIPQLEEIDSAKEPIAASSKFPWKKPTKKRLWMPGLAIVAGLFIALVVLNEDGLSPVQDRSAGEPELAMNSISKEVTDVQEAQQSASSEMAEKDFAGILRQEDIQPSENEPAMKDTEDSQNEQVQDTAEVHLTPNEEDPPVGMTGFTIEEERYTSPDGVFTAYLGLDKEELFIDKEEEAHYISKHSWKAPWTVDHIAWVSSSKLYYILYHPELDEYQYWLINLEDRTETQLEEAYKED